MSGRLEDIDVEGVRRGRCQKAQCPCYQFTRRQNSVMCPCGHTGIQHTAVVLCRGTTNGEICDCQELKTPPVPYNECLGCGHAIGMHGQGNRGEGGIAQLSNSTPIGGAGAGSDLQSARTDIRFMAHERREMDHNRRISSEEARSTRGGYGRGGRRPGAGRKSVLIKEKRISVTPVNIEPMEIVRESQTFSGEKLAKLAGILSLDVTMTGNFALMDLKDACRRAFSCTMQLDLMDTGDRVFRRMTGSEVFDNATDRDLAFGTCYYYNPSFNSLPATKPKRRSEMTSVDGECSETDWGKRRRENENIGDESELSHDQYKNGDGDESLRMDTDQGPSTSFISGNESTAPKSSVMSEDHLDFVDTYYVTKELGTVLLDFCEGDVPAAVNWLNNVLFDGENREGPVKELHRFYAFGERSGGEGGNDAETVYVKLRQFRNNDGPDLRDQIRAIWKNKNDGFHKWANVKFDEGIGDGPRNTYLQAIREYVLSPLFEGTDDHLVVTSATDLLMEREYYRGGQFMGHIVRHGQFVLAGLADVTKSAIYGTPLDRLYAAMEDIPSFDMQQLLRKVIDGGNEDELTDADNQEITAMINESGLTSGHTWVPPTQGQAGFYRVKPAEREFLVGHVAQHVVLIKRASQIAQLVAGFESVCKFQAFLKLCGGAGGAKIANILTNAYFPRFNESSMSKEQLLQIIQVEADMNDGRYQEALIRSIDEIVAKLDEDAKGEQSISKFVQLCTGSCCVPLDTVISFRLTDHCDFKANVCAKAVDVSKKWFECEDSRQRFVLHVLTEVRESYLAYNKY